MEFFKIGKRDFTFIREMRVLHQMIRLKGLLGKTPSVSVSLFSYLICFRPSSQYILHKHFFSINEVKSTIKKETNIKLLYPIA